MIALAIWMIVCAVAAFTLQNRPAFVLSTVLALRLAVPSTGGWVLIGNWSGNAAIHPSTLLLLCWSSIAVLSRLRNVSTELRRWPGVYFGLAFVCAFFALVALTQSGPTSLIGMTNAIFAPILFFFTLRVVSWSHPAVLSTVTRCFLIVMILEATLVLAQWGLGANLPWSLVIEFPVATRPLGTFDSPLDLGLAAALAIPLLSNVHRALFRYVGMFMLLAAAVISESRTPTVLAAAASVYLILTTTRSIRAGLAAISAIALAAVVVANLPIVAGIVERFTGDDGNSLAARTVASDYIARNLDSVLFAGNGWGSSYALKGSTLATSLENGYAILAFDLGGLAVAVLLAIQIRIAMVKGDIRGARVSALIAITGGFIYSGITTMSAISLVIWLIMAACLSNVRSATNQLTETRTASAPAPQISNRF